MADLASTSDLVALLEDSAVDAGLAEAALDAAEDLFERLCGRASRPFQAGGVRTEVKDGTGTGQLTLDYPLSALTSVKLGADSTAPDEALAVADKNVLRWRPGSRTLHRVNGWFGYYGDPLVVEVIYTAADDLPDAAKRAVLNGAALLYRRGGSDGATAERLGSYSIDAVSTITASLLAQDPAWQEGLRACRQTVFA